jgi:class 3 adenylate cyclase
MQRAGVPVKPRELRTDLPEAAEAVILKALSFEEAHRYARARDFGEALAQALMKEQSSAPLPQPAAPLATQALALEIAHVLFMDLVGYSRLPMDEQTQVLRQLQKIVRGTTEFSRAMENNDLISLPTGDGMALVFFRDPVVPIQCALEIAYALQSAPEIKLRMGVHSGPVYRIADINTNKNVSGGGINMAQRVMDCGDAGHILVSNTVAEVLRQLGTWAEHLHDLGECEVKHGMRVHLFNLYTDDLGNPNWPEKLRAPEPLKVEPKSAEKITKTPLAPALIVAAALLAVGTIIALLWRSSPVTQTGPAVQSPAATSLKRALSYSITVKPDRKPAYQVPGEMIFVAGDGVRLSILSPQSGYLYIINEGPAPKNGRPDYNTLFPSPSANGGASLLAAGQQLQIPGPNESARGFVLDQEEGAEKVWLIWSAQSVAELEALKRWANPKDKGEIKDPTQISAVQAFLAKAGAAKPAVEKDEQQTTIKGESEVLVHLIKLEHR